MTAYDTPGNPCYNAQIELKLNDPVSWFNSASPARRMSMSGMDYSEDAGANMTADFGFALANDTTGPTTPGTGLASFMSSVAVPVNLAGVGIAGIFFVVWKKRKAKR